MKIYNLEGKLIFDGPVSELKGANLRGANLQGANLQRANLQGAYLQGAYLRGAYLRWADFQDAYLRGADLRGADLRGANLQGADLRGADLREADLQEADLRGANLQDAYLQGAYLRGADLRGAYLQGADLRGADLQEADLQDIKIDYTTPCFHLQCPQEGSFIGFKKAQGGFIVKLKIPASALRSSATSRKCRVSKAKVMSITKGKESLTSCPSNYDTQFVYTVGEVVSVPAFNKDRWNECSTGIHLFITKEEAESYD